MRSVAAQCRGFVTSVRLGRIGDDVSTKRAKSKRSAGIEPTTPRLLVDKTIEVLWTTTVPTALDEFGISFDINILFLFSA
jgi:hypothetical protein